ncbi:siderophore-interacting protein [Streptomonospora litoralis]|uniref:Vibriobactin utilization protein ViuB n=1 Tax=Streptomonospora litoralis TaxID=2498135 RepID=A0A4V0ZJW9_9ACTN|nr:siderophore-interacting protein [Streptomonospora litoralis]QBI54942.1 Vibriobactin utilization protein ViuB [Streptomonospora litoralis]
MAERGGRRSPRARRALVQRVERLTPHMIRVVLGGDGLADFDADTYTDHYIKLLFPADGGAYPEPFDVARIREEEPRAAWPIMRTYTVRHWDAQARELTVDFVHHGDKGVAGPWAAAAQPGDELYFSGPGGAYAPDPAADWHLLAGDESALPAIAAALERLPQDARAHVFIEVADPEEEQKLQSPGGVSPTWLHRGQEPYGVPLARAVRDLDFPAGHVHAFVHGEAGCVRELRRLLRNERGIPLEQLSISGYWRTGLNEDGWQSAKREWNRASEEETEGAAQEG